MDEYIIEMEGIVKTFGEVQAIQNGRFNLKRGEIHSLIGENGAGKSTMMKLLYGLFDRDAGAIRIHGEPMEKITPKLAIEKGIGMVHQEFMLVPELTVLENIILGFEPRKSLVVDFAAARRMVQKYIDEYGMDVQMGKRVNQISVGEAQRVEIIKILSRGASTLILDEPTAVLTPQEAQRLFHILANLKKSGKSIIFISHKLSEVLQISDRISVMRRGEDIGTIHRADATPAMLAKMMIGREVFLDVHHTLGIQGETVLSVEGLWTSGEKELSKIRNLSLSVRAGEIVGIAGIDGNGQSELVEAITGLRRVEKGKVLVAGKDVTNKSPRSIRKAGLKHIPEDRNQRGLDREMNLMENLVAAQISDAAYSRYGVLQKKKIIEHALSLASAYDIRPPEPAMPMRSLSGGNAQKVVVAREVSMDGRVLIASQPTRGVDIGAIEAIEAILENAKANGVGVLLVSADLREILSLSDRILVMYEGRITGSMNAADASEDNLGILMMGGEAEKEALG